MNVTTVQKVRDLKARWTHLDSKKSYLMNLCEEYAQWTLPYVFPARDLSEGTEMQIAKDSIGAQAVNHLSNKVVSTLFPAQQIFFRLKLDQETQDMLALALQQAGGVNVEDAQQEVQKQMVVLEAELAKAEANATEYLDMVAYRPQAVAAAKLLVITGNALMFHPKEKPVQVYNLRNFCVVRDLSGQVIEIMTKESKAFETFHPRIQEQLRNGNSALDQSIKNAERNNTKQYVDSTMVDIYTQVRLEDDGKFHVYQCGDHIILDTEGVFYTRDELPWIPLVWNLIQGEDYGRGLVGDYAGAFHAVNVLTSSLLNIAAIMGDIKFFVKPASLVDVDALNQSAPGTFHAGQEGDVTSLKIDKLNDAQFIMTLIERYEKQIAQAFLLMSATTRQAERVTAEEIRRDANELETSNGGVYSAQAKNWQLPTANIVLRQSGFVGLNDGITAKIVTGLDSLSRAAELDNLRLFFMDLQLLNTVPEDVRAGIDVPGLMAILGTARQVEYKKFTKTAAQLQADQEAAMAQQQQLQDMQTQGAAQEEVAKGIAQDTE